MRRNFTYLILTTFVVLICYTTNAQSTGDYRSVNAPKSGTGGNWSDITKWERFDGAAWVAAATAPTSTDGVITIRANDSIRINVAVTADEIVVATDGVLAVNVGGFNLTLNNGAGDDLTVNGTLLLRGNNTLSGAGNVVINGIFNWFSGSLGSSTVTSASSVTYFSIPGLVFDKNLNTTLINNGLIEWFCAAEVGNGVINTNNATFTNNGTINLRYSTNGGFGTSTGVNTFTNNGTVNKTTTLQFSNNSVTFVNSASGVLKGIGTYNIGGAGLVNSGTTQPGNSPGILASPSALFFGQPASITIEVLDGSGPGTGHDRLDLTGSVNLSTLTLNVTQIGNAPLQAYTILTTTGTFTGTFGTVNKPTNYDITYNPTNVVITKTTSFPLPAVWEDFSAIAKGSSTVNLNWSTLQEINTSQFVIEHSEDGRQFSTIGVVPAAGNSDYTKKYSYVHKLQNTGSKNYYRIKLEDIDGKNSYSFTRVVKFAKGEIVPVVATPNPVATNLNLAVQQTVTIKLTDLNGRTVKTMTLNAGNHSVDMSTLPAGIYQLIVLKDGQLIDTQKIIKQ
jgi:hypothetical protein